MIKVDTTPAERALARIQKNNAFKQRRLKEGLEAFEDMVHESIVCDDSGRFEYEGIVGYVEPFKCLDGYLDWDHIVVDIYHRKLKKVLNLRKLRFDVRVEYTSTRVLRCVYGYDFPQILAYPDEFKRVINENKLAQEFKK